MSAAIEAAPHAIQKDPAPRLWSADEFSRMRELGLFADRDLLLDDGQLLEHFADGTSQAVVFTQADFCQLWDANFFRDQRVQLIGGEIVQESFMNPLHAVSVCLATETLQRLFGAGFHVRGQLPIDLTPTSRPHPDLAVVTGSVRDYAEKHPKTAVLVVEVSDSTLEEDTHTKMSLYAAAGIADYWVIDVSGRVLVFREPRPEQSQPFGFAYGSVSAHHRDDRISPLAIPNARIDVNDLLP